MLKSRFPPLAGRLVVDASLKHFSRFFLLLLACGAIGLARAEGMPDDAELRRNYYSEMSKRLYAETLSLNLPTGQLCKFTLAQIPASGEIVQVQFEQCQYAPEVQEVLRSHLLQVVLPYQGYERVFNRHLTLFCVQTAQCVLEG